MLTTLQFRVLMVLAVVALILAAADVGLLVSNRAQQQTLNERQLYIQQTIQAELLYRELVKVLGELAVRANDAELKSMLQAHTSGFAPAEPAQAPAGAAR